MDPNHSPLLRRLQKLEDYLFFSASAAALGLAVVAGYTLINRAALQLWLAWVAPLTFLIAGGVLLGLAWQRLATLRAWRSTLAEDPRPTAPRPPLGLRLLLGAAALGYLALFALVTGVSLRAVYTNNHLAGLVFALIYALLTGFELLAAWGLRSAAAAGADLRALLLPGGLNLARVGAFWLGFALPLVSMGLQAAQLPFVNLFFQRNKPWGAAGDVPLVAVLGLGLLYFLLLEGLLGQAGGTWERLNRGETLPGGKLAVVARWILALLLAYVLGGLTLLVLAAVLVLQQTLALGQGAAWQERRPGPAVMLSALGPALLYTGGTLAWLGQNWSYTVALAVVPVVYFLAVAYAAGQTRARLAGEDPLHTLFTHTRLGRWQAAGYAAAGFASMVLLIFLVLAENCRFYNSLISPNFARCIPTGAGRMAYFELGGLNGALLAFDLLILFLLLGFGLSYLLAPLGRLVSRLPQTTRRWLGWGLVGIAVVLIAVALLTTHASWLAAALLVRTLAAAVRSATGQGEHPPQPTAIQPAAPKYIFHIAQRAEWLAASDSAGYTPAAFAQDGFIHLCEAGEIIAVAGRYYHGQSGLVLLQVDAQRAQAPLRYEDLTGSGLAYPHLYGTLNLDAVTAVLPFEPGADGAFSLPLEVHIPAV